MSTLAENSDLYDIPPLDKNSSNVRSQRLALCAFHQDLLCDLRESQFRQTVDLSRARSTVYQQQQQNILASKGNHIGQQIRKQKQSILTYSNSLA
jgi:hypothetical protein